VYWWMLAQVKRNGPLSTKFLENLGLGFYVLLDCLRLYRDIFFGRRKLDLKMFVDDLREAGLTILLRITLVAIVVGLIIGIQSQNVLDKVNVPELLLGGVGLSIIKEFSPLLVGFFVAGRSGIALVVRIGSMVLNREIDGLIVSGMNPIQYIVGPMMLAMLLMSFGLAVWVGLVVLSVTSAWLWFQAAIPVTLFQESLGDVLEPSDLLISIIKPLVFSVLIVLIATVNGCRVGRHVEAVSQAATRTMISAIAAILLIDLIFVFIFGT